MARALYDFPLLQEKIKPSIGGLVYLGVVFLSLVEDLVVNFPM